MTTTISYHAYFDDGGDRAVEAADMRAAIREVRGSVFRSDYDFDDFDEYGQTLWVDARIVETIDGEETSVREITIQLDPDEPDCDDPKGHAWNDAGPYGCGGGVRFEGRCPFCDWVRHHKTWAQRPDNGTEGYTTTEYRREPRDED